MLQKKFLSFRYAAIKRYGDKRWTVPDGAGQQMEFNPNYTVSCSGDETGALGDENNTAYVIELSNGTKFIALVNKAALCGSDVLTDEGEYANGSVPDYVYETVRRNIGAYVLRSSKYANN